MRTSESISNIAKALAAAQGEMENPECNKTVVVTMKAGGNYSYKYATLPKCIDAIRKPFAKNGLSHSAFQGYSGDGKLLLRVRVYHESGEYYESEVELDDSLPPKDLAGDVTFWKRYLLNGIAGIAGDDDIEEENGENGPVSKGKPPPNRPRAREEDDIPKGKPPAAPRASAAAAAKGPIGVKKEGPVAMAGQKQDQYFANTPAPSLKRARGIIAKEILEVALKMNPNKSESELTAIISLRAQSKFGKELQNTTDDELESILVEMNSEMRMK